MANAPAPIDEKERRRELIKKAKNGDRNAAFEVQKMYVDRPKQFEDFGVEPAQMARYNCALIPMGSKKKQEKADELAILAWEAQMERIQTEVAGPNPSAIEKLLASRVATCWFDCHVHDALVSCGVSTEGMSHKQLDHMDRLRDRAHDRFLRACKALAYVRRVELNILLSVNNGGITNIITGMPPTPSDDLKQAMQAQTVEQATEALRKYD